MESEEHMSWYTTFILKETVLATIYRKVVWMGFFGFVVFFFACLHVFFSNFSVFLNIYCYRNTFSPFPIQRIWLRKVMRNSTTSIVHGSFGGFGLPLQTNLVPRLGWINSPRLRAYLKIFAVEASVFMLLSDLHRNLWSSTLDRDCGWNIWLCMKKIHQECPPIFVKFLFSD